VSRGEGYGADPFDSGSDPDSTAREMPLFPLNVVLFPGMPLPLQIFEPRYHEMMRLCLAGDRTFGVALIADGAEVGGEAQVWPVGTLARIERVERLPDGRLVIEARGMQRFRVLERLPDDPYPRAVVELIQEESEPDVDGTLVEEIQTLLLQFLRKLDWGDANLPDDPSVLGYLVGAVVPCSLPDKQSLLEARTANDLLGRAIPLIRDELDREPDDKEVKVVRPFRPEWKISAN